MTSRIIFVLVWKKLSEGPPYRGPIQPGRLVRFIPPRGPFVGIAGQKSFSKLSPNQQFEKCRRGLSRLAVVQSGEKTR